MAIIAATLRLAVCVCDGMHRAELCGRVWQSVCVTACTGLNCVAELLCVWQSVCDGCTGLNCVAELSITSGANLFLLFIGKERTNMAAPRGARIESQKNLCCINPDRRSVGRKPTNGSISLFAHYLHFGAGLLLHLGP